MLFNLNMKPEKVQWKHEWKTFTDVLKSMSLTWGTRKPVNSLEIILVKIFSDSAWRQFPLQFQDYFRNEIYIL